MAPIDRILGNFLGIFVEKWFWNHVEFSSLYQKCMANNISIGNASGLIETMSVVVIEQVTIIDIHAVEFET